MAQGVVDWMAWQTLTYATEAQVGVPTAPPSLAKVAERKKTTSTREGLGGALSKT